MKEEFQCVDREDSGVSDDLVTEMVAEIDLEPIRTPPSSELGHQRHDWGITAELIAKAKAHMQEVKARNSEAYGDEVRRRKWPKRTPKPKKEPKTDAERAKAYRDRKREQKIAEAPKADRVKLAALAAVRCELLKARLAQKPLPPKLRHLVGRERELSMAWMAQEVVRCEPQAIRRRGPPPTFTRIIELFAEYHPTPQPRDPYAAMRRRLTVVQFLEEAGVWVPAASPVDAASAASKE